VVELREKESGDVQEVIGLKENKEPLLVFTGPGIMP
jgi:hypothetical protein